MDNSKDTTLEVVQDDQGSAAWKECGPGGCTISRRRLDGKACNDARAILELLVADAMASVDLAATALRWTIPIGRESKRRKRWPMGGVGR